MKAALNSSLYECQVTHARLAPRAHRFGYRIFLFAVDLDELPTLSRTLTLFSVGRPNVYSFRERDYMPIDEPRFTGRELVPPAPTPDALPLQARVALFLARHGVDLAGGRVLLLTLPRVFGYGFNPVSFYFCFDRTGAPLAAIAEVTNTFREIKPYFLGRDAFAATTGGFSVRVPKHFYVSPFSDVDVAFDFTLQVPADRLSIRIDDYTGRARTFASTLTGTRRPLTNARLAWFTLKYPLISLRTILLIHWHALQLWAKRIPWFAKAARATDQRDLHRPHHSLTHGSAEGNRSATILQRPTSA